MQCLYHTLSSKLTGQTSLSCHFHSQYAN